jgi:inward rectifier potassium channel
VARATESDDILIVGAAAHPLRDAYHSLLRMRWWGVLGVIAGTFLVLNALFACGYVAFGGVSGMAPGSFRDAFFFSVQTMGTIGYGGMVPVSTLANTLVVAESVVGLIITALATGIVFARFSQASDQILFSRHVCISPMNGLPTLTFRVGNDRASTLVEAVVRVAAIRTERTIEGTIFYRLTDLELARDRSPALSRSWTVIHPITEKSPLFGATPQTCASDELELVVTIVGTDDTSRQPAHGRHRYVAKDIAWGARLADVLSEGPDGRLELDVRRFHEIIPVAPVAALDK